MDNYFILKDGVKLLMHSQTLMVQPFGKTMNISIHILLIMWLLIHARLKLILEV